MVFIYVLMTIMYMKDGKKGFAGSHIPDSFPSVILVADRKFIKYLAKLAALK